MHSSLTDKKKVDFCQMFKILQVYWIFERKVKSIVCQEMNFLDQCNAFVKCRVNLVLVTISLKIPFVEYHIGGFFHWW